MQKCCKRVWTRLGEIHISRFKSLSILSIKGLVQFLEPAFSEEGSNSRISENAVYGVFIKYVREVAAGKRGGLTLKSVSQFVTGAQEEPIL